jgi:hypothetical protein
MSDTHGLGGRLVGGPRPGRTDAAAGHGGGGVGHAVPARCRPDGARRASGTQRSWVRRQPWRRCWRHRPDPGAPGTCSAGSRTGGPWAWEPAGGRRGRPRRCHAHPPAAPGYPPARPCRAGLHQVGTAPPPQAEILHPSHIVVGDPPGIADHQHADALLHREGDDLLGGLMLGVVDAAAMPCLDPPQTGPIAAPAPRSPLPALGARRAAVACRAC